MGLSPVRRVDLNSGNHVGLPFERAGRNPFLPDQASQSRQERIPDDAR